MVIDEARGAAAFIARFPILLDWVHPIQEAICPCIALTGIRPT